MKKTLFTRETALPAPAERAFAWHARPGALSRLNPPWEQVEVKRFTGEMTPGTRVLLKPRLGPFSMTWLAEHTALDPGRSFRDRQVRGPFAFWEHEHRFEDAPGGSVLQDRIEYALPLGLLGNLVAGRMVRRRLERLFDYRHRVTAADLAAHTLPSLRILITGAGGLIGSSLVPFLQTGGHQVARMGRPRTGRSGPDWLAWSPARGEIDSAGLEGFDVVVHLAGAGVAGLWTEDRKKGILESRRQGTRLLSQALAALRRPPRLLLCASAVGYYGHDRCGNERTEEDGPGTGFLSEVTQAWEKAADPARRAGIRVAHARLGMVLTPAGGSLRAMLPAFRLGLGGRIGSGRQSWPWISMDDVLYAFAFIMGNESISGPVNLVTPHPINQARFAATVARLLRRPQGPPAPEFAIRMLGGMGREMLLAGPPVVPRKLMDAGHRFRYGNLESALGHLLGTAQPA